MANKCFLIGNLTKDVELHETQSGKKVATLNIAVNGYNDTTDFFIVNVWNAQAENCAKYLSKGKKVAIVGELHNRSYEDKDGNKRTVCEITANEVEFLSPKEEKEPEVKRERPTLTEITGDLPF